jgi:hypothetical protein
VSAFHECSIIAEISHFGQSIRGDKTLHGGFVWFIVLGTEWTSSVAGSDPTWGFMGEVCPTTAWKIGDSNMSTVTVIVLLHQQCLFH